MLTLQRVQAVRPTPIIDSNRTVLPPDDIVYLHNEHVGPTVAGFANLSAGDEIFICDFNVTPELAADNIKVELEVRLPDDSVLFSGTAMGQGQSPLTIVAKLTAKPQRFQKFSNDKLRWFVKTVGDFASLDTSDLDIELYFLTLHDGPLDFRFKGVPLTALRDLSSVNESVSGASLPEVHQVERIFEQNPPIYDARWGLPDFSMFTSFPTTPGSMTLELYYNWYVYSQTNRPRATMNCYDTASLTQYYFSLLGFDTTNTWGFMSAFGYLHQRGLIGIGQCNNPFFDNPEWTRDQVVDQTDSGRSAFAFHAAVVFGGMVWDACIGPSFASTEDYWDESVDTVTPSPPKMPAGTEADLTYNPGVTLVIGSNSSKVDMAFSPVAEFAELTGFDWGAPSAPTGIRPLRSPLECPAIKEGGWDIGHEELLPGYPDARRFWCLQRDENAISLSIFVASDSSETSRHRFLGIGCMHQMPSSPFARGPAELGEFSAVLEDDGYRRYLWVHGNTVVDLKAHSADNESLSLARWVQEMIADLATLISLESPSPLSVDVSATELRVNEKVTITGGSQVAIDIDCVYKGLRYARLAPGLITLVADAPSQNTLNVCIVDRETSRSECQQVAITVRDE